MMTVKDDLEQRIAALPRTAPKEEVMRVVGQVRDSVLDDLKMQLSCLTVDKKIEILAQLIVKNEVDAAMMALGFKSLIAELSART